ncbi:unnamed protein product [Leptosia nina]|uniref:RNA-directed DNA polymerase n=1 Tax=Leptosia nina TaxID=320188 RepID=A0AAV1IZ93_9NEOP
MIDIKINNSNGYAYLDSAARTSIAGTTLYRMLLDTGYSFTNKEAVIHLADGKGKNKESLSVFLNWCNNTKMLSPIPAPPPIVRPREPRADNEDVLKHKDPRVKYIKINPVKLYSVDVSFQDYSNITLRNDEAAVLGCQAQTQLNNLLIEYQDDLHLRSMTFTEHLESLREIFDKLKEYNLRANRNKCKFGCSEIKYLGHLIIPEGIKADPEKVSAIQNLPPPKNLKQLISFLQTTSWYRRFIKDFASIAQPLTMLTKKKSSWQWSTEQQNAYDLLKNALITSPVLRQAINDEPFVLKTDASYYAIGAALLQGEGPNEHVVEYASRLLTPPEKNYTVTEKEALAIVWAVAKFRGYIEGSKFITITDHQPLKWLMALKTPTGRLARWALQLQPYEFEIQYSKGRTNFLADLLSRPQCDNYDDSSECSLRSVEIELPRRSEISIRESQLKDEILAKIINVLEKDADNEDYIEWNKKGYLIHKGVLYRYIPDQDDDNAKLLVPKQEINAILKAYHDSPVSGHVGVDKTIARITNHFWWSGIRKDVIKHIKSCIDCQRYKPSNLKPAGLFQSTANSQRFETLSIDLFGPLPKSLNEEKWVFIIEDVATKWIELFAMREATSEACAHILINEIILRYGIPRKLISDNGTQFISAVIQKLTFCMGIDHILTPVYHPQPNIVERRNRDLKTQMAILVNNQHRNWPTTLPAIKFALNTAVCQSTGFTPAYLVFGRELRTPYDLAHDLSTIVQSENFVTEITPTLKKLGRDLKIAKENIEKMQELNRDRVNTTRRPDPGYNPGDLVLIETHPISNQNKSFTSKLAPRRDGPYIVIRKKGSSLYEVANVKEPEVSIGKFHTSALVKYEHREAEDVPELILPIRKRGRPKKTSFVNDAGALIGTNTKAPEGEDVTPSTPAHNYNTRGSSRIRVTHT